MADIDDHHTRGAAKSYPFFAAVARFNTCFGMTAVSL
jgi:hypothetical protein